MITVNKTTEEDIDEIEFNRYVIHTKDMLKISMDYQYMYSFKLDGKMQLICAFFEFYPHCWKCGIIASRFLNKRILPYVRSWMLNECKERGCRRLETEGASSVKLSRFHRFFGFKPEVLIDEGRYIKWVL